MRLRHVVAGVMALASVGGCRESTPRRADSAAVSEGCRTEARQVVEDLGRRMRNVSLLATDSLVTRSLQGAYGSVVTPQLLQEWQATPRQAPGREVSSPWPARIAIDSIRRDGDGCRVSGAVEYVTSADTTTAIERRPVTLRVVSDRGWRVSSYETGASSPSDAARPSSADSVQPADVVRQYYAAIDARNYPAAYALWGQEGQASGQTLPAFERGFASTEHVRAIVGDSVRIEGAAGSQYATVPVTVDATLRDGRAQHFTGTYTVRRAMVDGATPAQRRWHIYKADLQER